MGMARTFSSPRYGVPWPSQTTSAQAACYWSLICRLITAISRLVLPACRLLA